MVVSGNYSQYRRILPLHDEDEEKTFDPLPDAPISGVSIPSPSIPLPECLSQERLDRIANVFALYLPAREVDCFDAIFSACKEKKWDQIKHFETECDSIVNAQGRSLLLEAIEQGEMELAETLIKRNIALHLPDREGNQVAHYAIRDGCAFPLPWEKIDIKVRNQQEQTPLHLAAEKGDEQVIADLIANGAAIDARARFTLGDTVFEGVTPLHIAIICNHHSSIDILLNNFIKRADPTIELPQVGNLLHIAIHFRKRHALRHLLTTYFEQIQPLVSKQNREGRTPTMEAAFQGDGESLVFLKEKGASLDDRDPQGRTALHWAALGRKHIAINLLYYYRCDLRAEDVDNNRPLDLVRGFRDSASLSIFNHLKNLSSQRERLQHVPSLYAIYPPENLVFKGGGPKGIAYVGAMRALEEEGALRDLRRVAGTSAGAINSTFIACGYSAEEMEAVLRETDLTSFLDHPLTKTRIKEALKNVTFSGAVGGIYSLYQTAQGAVKNPLSLVSKAFKKLWKTTGLCQGEVFRRWIEGYIQRKTKVEHCTFGELATLINQGKPFKHLHIFTTRISNTQLQHIHSEDPQWKDVIISDAVRASMSVPGVFDAHILHCKREGARLPARDLGKHVDGGLIRNFPIEAFDKRKYLPYNPREAGEFHMINERTLGLSLYSPKDKQLAPDREVETVGDLLRGILSIYSQAEELLQEQTYDNQFRTILIDNQGVGTTEFHLSEEKKDRLITSGKHAVGRFYAKQKQLSTVEKGSMVISRIAHQATYGTNIELLPEGFIERTSYLEELSRCFFQESSHLIQVVLWGFSGHGKSSIALDFANRNLEKFSLVWKIDCEKESDMRRSYQDLANAVGIRCKEDDPLEQIQRRVHYFLESKTREKPYLLIFDNVEKAPTLPKRGGCILITSREKGMWNGRDCLEVNRFTPEEGERLLTNILEDSHQEILADLAKELGYHPATIAQTANYIVTTPGMTTDAFLALVKRETKRALQLARPDGRYPIATIASWEIIQNSLERSYPEALHWLRCCAYLAPDALPIRWLNVWLQENNDFKRGEILRILTEKGLIHYDQQRQTLSLHRLRQHLCRICMSEENRQEILVNTLQLLHDIANNFDFNTCSHWSVIAGWIPHAETLLTHDVVSCGKQADLLHWLGQWKERMSQYEEGLHCHRNALDMRKSFLERDHLDIVASLSEIALCLFRLGKYQEGIEACREAIKIRRESVNNDCQEIARNQNSFGLCLSGLGRDQEALEQHREALAIRKKALGEEHSDVAASLNSIGTCLSGLGRDQEALEQHRKALAISKKALGKEHPDVATDLNNIGYCLFGLGRYQEGLEHQREALAIWKKALGEEHPDVAVSLNNIGNCLHGLERYQEALEQHRVALAIWKKALGEEHPDVAVSLGNIGACLSGLGRDQEALEQHGEALAISKKALGKEHPDVASSLNNIGNCLHGLERDQEALEQHRVALAIWKKALGEEHPDVAVSLGNIGACLSRLGRHQEALEQHGEALAIRKKALGEDHPHVAVSLNNIGACLSRLGRHQEALENQKQAFIIACCHFKQEHPDIVIYLKNIVACLKAIDKKNIYKSTKEELLPFCMRILGENHECTRYLANVKGDGCVIQ